MSEWEIEQIRNSIAEQQYVHSPHPELSGGSSGGGTGGLDTSIHTRENSTCPANTACVPAGDATGMFVKDTATNNIYFSQAGYDRAINGADTDWAGVDGDLLRIAGQSAAAVGLGSSEYLRILQICQVG